MIDTPIAVLGATGDAGFGLALRWTAAGMRVIIGSRDAGRAENAAAEISHLTGKPAEGETNPDAVARSTLVVLSVPFAAQAATIASIVDSIQLGTTIVDITVPLATSVGGRATQTVGVWEGSAAQRSAALLKGKAPVVAAFQNIAADALRDLEAEIDEDIIACGPKDAKERIVPLIEALPGARFVDGGPLENARHVEHITALLAGINGRYKVRRAGIRITGLPR